MDIQQLYQDFSVDYKTEGHKHCRPGWINTECPWCSGPAGHEGYHLGFHLQTNHYVCWRCGFHPIASTVAKLIQVDEREVRTILKTYGQLIPISRAAPLIQIKLRAHKLPSNTAPLSANHKNYLARRGFDPDELEATWNLVGTGPYSVLSTGLGSERKLLDYKHRILIPFFWNDQQVSFDSRDITGKHPSKYMACPSDREYIPHKDILYGLQKKWGDVGICLEGPTDVWRFGDQSFATSGIKYTPKQIRLIAQTFKIIPVCFDGGEPQAKIQADKLVAELKFRGRKSFRVDIEGDPGGMNQDDANHLVRDLLKTKL